jgi:uncharacterized protein YndB with AHSA1/START domain
MSRNQKHVIQINATPDQVWQHISEAEGIVRWFAPEASVTPGEGGSVMISWGPGMEGTAPIHIWEPGHRLAWKEGTDNPKLIDFQIEAKDGTTTLTLVQSGFGEGAKFEDEYEAVNGGWRTYMRALKFALEHHQGATCTPVSIFRVIEATRDELTPKLAAALGLSPTLEDLREDQSYTSTLGLSGLRLEPDKPGYFLLTIDEWNHSLLALFIEQMGDKSYFTLQGWLFGEATSQAAKLKSIFNEVQL